MKSNPKSMHTKKIVKLFGLAAWLFGPASALADPLSPGAFPSLGPNPFASGTYTINASFNNPAPTIMQGATLVTTGVFHDPTPGDPANRDEIAVFNFDSIEIPP